MIQLGKTLYSIKMLQEAFVYLKDLEESLK